MKRFHRLRDVAAAIVLSLALVCVSTTALLPKFAYADPGDFCFTNSDCDDFRGETCVRNTNPWMPGGTCQNESLQACTEQERRYAMWLGVAGATFLLVGMGAAAGGSALVASGYALYFNATWGGALLTSAGAVAYGSSIGSAIATFGSALIGLHCEFG